MQGFNRYYPPDFDPKKNPTLNSYHGKHALGARAKDIDKGILVVRFELPFNIWCGTCNAHLGAGVRYNAQKRKVGNYYSTPIYAFRCKCHLCSGWFEIRTDPKNSAYVVEEGARKKDEDWDPEENGGYAVHDTEAPSAAEPPADPFGHLEKTVDQQTWAKEKKTRLTELYEHSDRLSSDPYLVSSTLRRKFREEKRVALEKQARDIEVADRFGLGEGVILGDEEVEGGRERWIAGRERRGLEIGSSSDVVEGSMVAYGGTPGVRRSNGKGRAREGSGSAGLAKAIRRNTARRFDPFNGAVEAFVGSSPVVGGPRARGRVNDPTVGGLSTVLKGSKEKDTTAPLTPVVPAAGGLLLGYESD